MTRRANELHTLALAGTMPVRGCGDHPPPGRVLERPPQATLDGEPVAIRGATFRSGADGPGTWLLTLGDAPALCRGGASDVAIVVRVLSTPGSQDRSRWVGLGVSGRRLGTDLLEQRAAPLVIPTPVRGEDQTVTVDLDLHTADDEAAFLRLGIAGPVTAVD